MTNATNPTTAQPPAAAANAPAAQPQAAPASDTAITLGGKEVQLRGITPEQAQTLYAALPAEYQKRADAYAAIAKNFERVLKIDLPQGMSIGQAWTDYNAALNKGVNFARDGVAPHLKQLDELVKGTPLAMLRRADTAATTIGRAADAASAWASDMLGFPASAWDFLSLMASEATGAVAGKVGMNGISEEKAKAFGAVFAAAEFHESAVRQGMPVVDFSTNSVIWNYKSEAAGAAVEHATSTTAWTYIKAAFKFVANLLSSYLGDDKKKYEGVDFMQRLSKVWDQSEAEAKAEQAAKDPSLTYEQRLVARVKAGETDRAAEKVQRAEVPQSLGTPEGLVAVAAGKALYAGTDGTTQHVTRNPSGMPAPTALAGADGKPVTRTDRVADAASQLMPKTMEQLQNADRATVVGVVVGAGITAAVGTPIVVGATEGMVRGVINRPDRVAAKAEAKMDALDQRAKAVEASNPQKAAQLTKAADRAEAIVAKYDDITQAVDRRVGSMAASDNKIVAKAGDVLEHVLQKPADSDGLLRRWSRKGTEKLFGAATWVAEKAVGGVDNTIGFVTKHAPKLMPVAKVAGVGGLAIAPAFAAADISQGIKEGNEAKVANAKGALATMAGDAAIGAGVGALILGPVGALGGAVVGAGVGGIVSLFTGGAFEEVKETAKAAPASPTKPAGALGAPDKGLAEAAAAMEKANQARLAQVAAESSDVVTSARMAANRMPFAKVTSSQQVGVADLGSFKLDGVPQSSFAQMSLPPMA